MSSDPAGAAPPGRPVNLWDRLVTAAGRRTGTSLYWWDSELRQAPWSQVIRTAERMTAGLRAAGVRPGSRVASVLTNTPETVSGLLGTWLAGGALASLPVQARGMDADEYAEQVTVMCERLRPEAFFVAAPLLRALPPALRTRYWIRTWESVLDSGTVDPCPPGDDDLAFIQYSSGSTSVPKGCMLTPRAIAAQEEMITLFLDGRPGDRFVSWLPLSHDMGLFGTLMSPWFNGYDLFMSSPERFAMAPRTWFGDVARYAATITVGTNSALHLAARAHASRKELDHGDLTSLRVAIIGAERVEWDTLRLAQRSFGRFGMREEALMPAYGLAEGVLAVTATPVYEAPRYVAVDGVALANGEIRDIADDDPAATRVVSAGVPVRGAQFPGLDGHNLGEVRIRSASLASGYWADPERTEQSFTDGTFLTNDLGFVRDGHFYPVGRSDDMLSIAGRKVYAREIEQAVEQLAGVRAGCSTLIGDQAGLTLCVEVKPSVSDYPDLAAQAAQVAMAKAAVALDRCVFLERNTVPKTPSGKIQRHRCRYLLATGRFSPLAVVDLA